MLALVVAPDSPERVALREVPNPDSGPNQTLLAVEAMSLNRGEMNRLASASEGDRFGWDIAGTVRVSHGDHALPAGTRVVGFVRGAGWAESVVAPNLRLAEIPQDLSFAQAATLPVAGLTALRMLRIGGFLLGRRVLITGAAGGVGTFAVQLAKLAGAHVTGIAGSSNRGNLVRDVGAGEVLSDIGDATGQFDLILEAVGGSSLAQAMQLINAGGTVVTFGNSSHESTSVSIDVFYSRNGARIQAFSILAPSQEQNFRPDLYELASLVARGDLRTEIGLQVNWRQAADALAALRDRRVRGKAVLTVN